MTIATRRRVYWALFLASLCAFGLTLVMALPVATGSADTQFLKLSGAYRIVELFGIPVPSPLGAALGALVSGLAGVLILASVLSSFRKTVSHEIFFFSFWALCLGLEGARVLVFRLASAGVSTELVMLADRAVLAGRSVGSLAFFASGLYAAGFRNEKLGSVSAVILVIGVAVAGALPLNTGVYEPSFLLMPGYARLAWSLSAALGLVTVANFLYASWTLGEKSYRIIALGSALLLSGRLVLDAAWTPFGLVFGALLLGAGARLFVSRLHAHYLWQ